MTEEHGSNDDSVLCGTIQAWATKFSIPETLLHERLEHVTEIPCLDFDGNETKAYPEDIVRKRCADLIERFGADERQE